MQNYQYRWIPAPLIETLFPNGERWELQSLAHSPGYWKYEGKVCRHETYSDSGTIVYTCELGTFCTMLHAAKALLKQAKRRNAAIDRSLGR